MNSEVSYAKIYLKRKEYLSPHFARLTFENPDIDKFKNNKIGENNKIFIPPAGTKEVYLPTLNTKARRMEFNCAPELIPQIRTYTHRAINIEKKEMVIEFAIHGENGPASSWAINAKIGAALGLAMKKRNQLFYFIADWYLLITDLTGLPATEAILESITSNAKGQVFIEVPSEEDIRDIPTHKNINIEWIVHPNPGINSPLVAKVKEFINKEQIPESKSGHIATEYNSVKELRNFLRNEKNWTTKELKALSYWRYGKSEGEFSPRDEN